jgi:hypothetical protein
VGTREQELGRVIDVIFVTPLAAAPPGGPSSTLSCHRRCDQATSFDLKALEALPVTKGNVTYFAAGVVVTQSFTGTLLWDVSQSVGIGVNPKIGNAILRKAMTVTGGDGYQSVFGAGEIVQPSAGPKSSWPMQPTHKLSVEMVLHVSPRRATSPVIGLYPTW